MRKRIAILGGTFDPIHIGHLAIAEDVRWALEADQVLFVPAAQQPLKHERHLATAAQRLDMVELAIADNAYFVANDIESRRGGVSYTIDTVLTIRSQHPDSDLFFIVGADAVRLFPRWHQIERLIALCRFAVVRRPGYALVLDDLIEQLPMLRDRIAIIDGPLLDISASELRQRLREGRPARYHLPQAVWHYIEQHGLYRKDE